MRLLEFDAWTTTEDLKSNEYLQSCETIQDFEIALEALYETEEEAGDAAVDQTRELVAEGIDATSKAVKLHVVLERPGRVSPDE
jgi:hypothetical protein